MLTWQSVTETSFFCIIARYYRKSIMRARQSVIKFQYKTIVKSAKGMKKNHLLIVK